MRKLTLLITMLFLSVGMAWAQTNANGSLVTFTNVQKNGAEAVLYITDDGVLDFSTESAAELGEAAQFRATKQSDGKWTFYNEDKNLYMIWRGDAGGHDDNDGLLATYSAEWCNWTVVKSSNLEGGFFFYAKRGDNNQNGTLVKMANGSFNKYSGEEGWGDNYSNVYRIDVVDHFGFKPAKDYASINKWYYLTLNKFYLYNDGTSNEMYALKNAVDTDDKDAYTWAFIGNPFDGYKVANKKGGYLNCTNSGAIVGNDEHTFTLTVSTYHSPNGFFMAGEGKQRFNRNGSSGKLVYWSGADGGSTFNVVFRDDAADLQALIDDAEATLQNLVEGTTVGYVTADSKNNISEAISDAETAIQNGSGYVAAEAALKAAVSSVNTIQPEVGKYYTINSEFYKNDGTGEPIGLDVNVNKLIFNRNFNVSKWFQFVDAGNGQFYLYNVKSGLYLSSNGGHNSGQVSANATTTADAKAVTITNMGNGNIVKIVPVGGAMIHAQAGGNVVAWDNEEYTSASAWTIVEVENPGVAYIDNTNYATLQAAIEAWTEGKTINLLANTDETVVLPKGMKLDVINFNGFTAPNVKEAPSFDGEGTDASPYIINNEEMLVALRDAVNGGETFEGKYFKLTSDIALNGEWTAIGNGSRSSKNYSGNAFKGTFDGDNKIISGLNITSTTGDDAAIGLFGVVDGGTVKNLTLNNVDINVANSDLAGGAIGLMLNGATADNITVNGAIVGNDGVGGIVGRLVINGTIENCTNNASVTSSYGGIGGIVGKAYYEDGANTALFASIENSTNNGTVTAPMYVGGIVGLARANVTGCVNNGPVVGGTQTGGIIGQLIAAGTVSGNENKVKITGKNHLGGIIGDYSQSSAYTYYNVAITSNINRGELAATEQCAAIMGCNNIDGFTAMTATGNLSYYFVEGLELFGNPEDMVIDATNKFMVPVAKIGDVDYYTFEDALAAAQAGETITLLADVTCTEKPVFNNGGVVNVDINGHILVSNEQGRIRNVVSADGQVASNNIKFVSGFGWEVYSGNGVEGANFRVFPTLNEAVAYIPASDRVARIYLYENIKLENDVTLRKYSGGTSSTICVDPGYEITLNLNGYTVLQESPTGNPLEACIRGSLVLDDTSEAKTGKWIAGACGVTDKSNSWYGNGGPAFYVLGDGELILKGGAVSIARNTSMNSNGEPVVNTGGLIRLDSGSLTVDGATLQCDDTYGVMAWGGNVVVNSGEFVLGENGYYSVFASKYYADASVEVNKAIDGYLLISSTATATVNVPGVKYVANGTDYLAPAVGEGLIALDGQVYVPAVDVPEDVVGNIVSNNSGNSNVTEDAVTAIVNGLYNNGDVIKYVPTNIPDGAKLVVELKNVVFESASDVPATVVYDVTPKNGDAEVEPTEEITFRLPVPESWAGKYTKVYHSGIALEGLYPVQEGNYVEVASQDFSEFAVETVDYIVLPDGVNSSNYAELFGDNTVTDGTNYYVTLQAAVEAVVGQANAVLYCKPGADVGSLQHAPVTSTLTVYGNGADVTGDTERDFDLGNTDPSGGKDITADMTLTVKHLNGCGAWGTKATEHTVNLVFENCANMGKVYITGTTGTLNITMTDCAFEGVIKEAVYSNADGAITLTNVAFSNLNKAVNLNHKAAGTQTVTIDGCTFTDCGADVTADQIPVRVLSSVEGGKSVLAVTGSTFTGTPEGGADILLDYGVGLTTASVSGTAANVVVEKENNVGTTTDVTAEETVEFTTALPVAQVGETKYMTLQAAVEAATEGATITMLGDVTLTETVTIPADKTVTIDLNGKTVTRQDEATEYAINNLGTLTIQDTKGNGSINARGIYNGYGNGGANVATAKITVLSGTINAKGTNGGGAAIFNYGVADIQGGTFTSVASYAIALQTGSTMTIGENAIITGGINSWQSTLTITGGTISNDKSGKHVVYAGESAVTINGGTFHNNNSGNATILASGSTAAVEITGGTFTLNIVDASSSYLIDATSSANYTISGGSFTGGIRAQGGTKYEITGGTFTNEYGNYNVYEGGDVNISGGTFTGSYAQKFATDNLADGYELDENGTVVQVNYVAQIGETKYNTLQAAVEAVKDGETITLIDNVTVSEATAAYNDGTYIDGVRYTGDKSFTVDFNGKTVTDDGCVNDYLIYINNKGEKASEITFTNGTIVSKNGCWSAVCVNSSPATQNVVLNLNGMNITNSNDAEYSGNPVVRVRDLATVNVNDGTIITSNGASYGVAASTDGSTLNINEGATIVQQNSGTTGGNSVFAAVGGKGVINIKGGTITSDRYGVHTMTTGTPVINISGGTITAPVALKSSTNGGNGELATINVTGGTINGTLETYTENGKIVVSGGTFSEAVAQEYCAEGFVPKDNGDGTYGVVVDPAYGKVAKVGDAYYATLADAVAAAADGATVTMLSDVELTETVKVVGKAITLDLNGKTVSGVCNSSQGHLVYIENGAGLTVKNGAVDGGGKLTYAQGTSNVGWTVAVMGNLTLESGTIELTGEWSIGYAVDVRPNAWGVAYTAPSVFTMNGGNVVSSDGAVRVASSSSDIYADVSASFVMNGGKIDAAWDGVFIQQSNTAYDVLNFTINGGTIESGLNPVRVYGPAPTSYVNGKECMSINFNGGTMTYTGTETLEWVIDGVLRVGGGSSMETIVENGNITAGEEFAQAQALPDGYKWEQDGETYKVVEVPAIAKIGEQGYASLADAVAAAEGETVTMLADVELTESLVIAAGKVVTLDLNGKTVSMADASGKGAYAIKNNGNLTIVDNSDAKTGKITFNSTTPDNSFGYATSTIGNGGSLTVESGTIENTTVGGASYAIDGIWHTDEASLTINGGTIVANKIAVRQVPFSATANNVVTVNGGTLTGATAGLQLFNINNDAKLAEVNIHGGEFNGTYAFYTSFTSAAASEDVTINIDGGEFNGYLYLYNGKNGSDEYPMTVSVTGGTFNGGAYIYTTDANGVEVAIPSITGGTFANDVTDYCAEGFVCEANSDGTYGIVADPNYIAEFTIDDAARVDYVNDTDKTVGTLTYKRTFAEGAWNPLYLPFQVDVAQLADNYDIAYYNQMLSSDSNNDGAFDSYIMEVAYITSGTLRANYPYFIRPKTSDDCYLEYVANDVTLYAAIEKVIETSSVANTFKLHGTHKTVSAADLAGCYTIKASGWVQTTIDLRPHRLYLEILENNNSPFVPAAAKSIRIVVRGEDGYTGVEGVESENGEDMIFDLQGRRVLEPQKGGMYIINGKKVIF